MRLRRDLTRRQGSSLTTKTEKTDLAAIRQLTVSEEILMVARVTLNHMTQDREEIFWSFGARLRGQAGVGKFVLKCKNCDTDINYADAISNDVLTP